MDEKQAWNLFARTGKIEDYIKYTQIRNQAGTEKQPIIEIQGGPAGAEVRSVFPVEVRNADQDPGAYHPGADGGGER